MTFKKLILSCALFLSLPALGWGPVGHRTIGVIAEAHLTPSAKAAVQRLLGKDSLADVANWADMVRGDGTYHQTVWYHFEKIPDGGRYLENLKALPDWQKQKGGVVAAILVAQDKLRADKVPVSEQTDALKFLVHFVGDLHQPFHTGRPEDNGAVKIDVTWFGTPMNLHRIWDSGMINTGHHDLFATSHSLAEDSLRYASFVMKQYVQEPVDTSFDVEKWLNESLKIRNAAYDPIYQSDQSKYQSLHLQELDLRIYAAGIRLAELLNSIYAHEPLPKPEIDFWKQIESLVGALDHWISFQP